jgi:hypothetical protein
VLLVLACRSSFGQYPTVFVDDNLDSYADQAAFDAVWTPAGTAAQNQAALLTQAQSSSAPNAAHVPVTGTNGEYRSRRTFADTVGLFADEVLTFSFDFREGGFFGNPQRNFASLHDTVTPVGNNQLISMGSNNSLFAAHDGGQFYMARILGFTPTYLPTTNPAQPNPTPGPGSWFKLNDPGAPPRASNNVWTNLKVELSSDDGLSTDYKFYVNDVLAKTVLNVGTTTRGYDNIALGSGLSNGANEAFFDNVSLVLDLAPEPGTLDGDYNDDGKVDAADYVVWRQYAGTSLPLPNDPHGGEIGQLQFDTWKANFGEMEMPGSGSGSTAGAVPEPAGLALAAIALAALVVRRRW